MKLNISDSVVNEVAKYQDLLIKGVTRSSVSGGWYSVSSGVAYTYTNETDLMNQLKIILADYLVSADEWNAIITTPPIIALTNYYVSKTGNDLNNGLTSGTAFLTINRAVNMLPKQIDNSVFIFVGAGTYSEYIVLKDFWGSGTVTISGARDTTIVNSTNTVGTICPVYFDSMKSGLASISQSHIVTFSYITLLNTGILFNNSTGYISNCSITNATNAIRSTLNSFINCQGNTGTGNTNVFVADNGGTIVKSNTNSISGTNLNVTTTGGVIR